MELEQDEHRHKLHQLLRENEQLKLDVALEVLSHQPTLSGALNTPLQGDVVEAVNPNLNPKEHLDLEGGSLAHHQPTALDAPNTPLQEHVAEAVNPDSNRQEVTDVNNVDDSLLWLEYPSSDLANGKPYVASLPLKSRPSTPSEHKATDGGTDDKPRAQDRPC